MDDSAKENRNRDFVRAAEIGDIDTVRKLLDLGVDIEFALAPTPGIFANQSIYPELARMSRAWGHDIDGGETYLSNRTALQAAADGSHGDVLRLLVDSGADINPPPRRWGRSALQGAVDCEDESLVQLLLEKGANPNEPRTESSWLTALQAAARKGNEKLVARLLAFGADVNAGWHDELEGRTTLIAAMESGNARVVLFLLQAGADRHNALEWWALKLTCVRAKTAQFLRILNFDHAALGTALTEVARMGDLEIVQLLLDAMVPELVPVPIAGESPPAGPITHPGLAVRDELGRNILHLSCAAGNIDLVRFLLTIATQDVRNARDHPGLTPLHLAVGAQNLAVIELLLESGVNLEIIDYAGNCILRTAVDHDSYDIFRALLKWGAKTDGLPIRLAPWVITACGGVHIHGGMLLLQRGSPNGTHLSNVSVQDMTVMNVDDHVWASPSICFPPSVLSLAIIHARLPCWC